MASSTALISHGHTTPQPGTCSWNIRERLHEEDMCSDKKPTGSLTDANGDYVKTYRWYMRDQKNIDYNIDEHFYLDKKVCIRNANNYWEKLCVSVRQQHRGIVCFSYKLYYPCRQDLLMSVYSFLLLQQFSKEKHGNCDGCITYSVFQYDHVNSGCMAEDQLLYDLYAEKAHRNITPALFKARTERILPYFPSLTIDDSSYEQFQAVTDPRAVLDADNDMLHLYEYEDIA